MTHQPVLCNEVQEIFASANLPQPLHFLDGTFGRGGHSRMLLDGFPQSQVTAVDRDLDAVAYGKKHMDYGNRFRLLQGRFSTLDSLFPPESFSGVLLDLGVSSPQLEEAHRGFSFTHTGPLDMRMEQRGGSCAADLIHHMKEEDLAYIFFQYGQEKASRRIARAIVHSRINHPITTTQQLSDLVKKVIFRRGKIHAATRVFQALRIAVNEEMEELHSVLPAAMNVLRAGGCLVVIAFHSLEDRVVKNFFRACPRFSAFSKKPIRPCQEEIRGNPRARSACLRFGVCT